MSIELREPKTADDFALYYDLRWRILREPWTQDRESSKDEHEALAVHLMAWVDNQLVGVGRLHFNLPEEAQIRYMAVEGSHAGRGVGNPHRCQCQRKRFELLRKERLSHDRPG
jgi:acetyltransferase (GNAT) family protein